MPPKHRDRLSTLIRLFRVQARIGRDTVADGSRADWTPNLFVLHRGRIALPASDSADGGAMDAPALVFFPRGLAGVRPHISAGAEWVAARVDLGGAANPIALALPQCVNIPLTTTSPLRAIADLLLDEALAPRCGGGAVIDRLAEILIIRLLRHVIEGGEAKIGLLAGLGHPRLSSALIAMHDHPERDWRLDSMAAEAAMSRTRFAITFRDVVGVPPGEYLSGWRLTLTRAEIAQGKPLKAIARRVGFSGPAALSRAFSRRYGVSPRQAQATRTRDV